MAIVPLGMSAYHRSDGLVPEVRLYNLCLEKDESGISPDGTLRIERPRLTEHTTLDGIVRGMSYDPGAELPLTVAGTTLYRGFSEIATGVSGTGIVAFTTTRFFIGVCNGSSAWLYDGSTLIPIIMPDGRAVVDIDQLDNYILLLCSDGRFYWLSPGESIVDPLNFANAESSADGGVAIRRIGDEFWIFGRLTIEPWQPTADLDAPFERSSGRIMAAGCMARSTVLRMDNTLFWVREDGTVCRGAAVPEVVSTPAISERIRNRTGAMNAWTFGFDGHLYYVLRIPGQGAFVYDVLTRNWSRWGSDGRDDWIAWVGSEANGPIYAGSYENGTVWRIEADGGETFERVVTATVPITGKPPRNDSLTVGVGCSADTVMRLRWRDGQDDYPDYYEELECRAPYDLVTLYRLGQPQAPYREVEISFVGPERVRVAGCLANDAWNT